MGTTEGLKRVLLNTPDATPDRDAAYGGGHGGYVRMASVLLDTFHSKEFELVPCYHSVRRRGPLEAARLPFRLGRDVGAVVRAAKGAAALHMTLQYRRAIVREVVIALATRLLGLPLLVDIRAGSFKTWYDSASRLERKMTAIIVKTAKEITVEGLEYVEFVLKEFGRQSTYFPNFVPTAEIPALVRPKCTGDTLRVLFVGFCYDGKGVKELVEGCTLAAARGQSLHLTLAGSESDEFGSWMSRYKGIENLVIDRPGGVDHDRVLALYENHDVFCLPTRHAGEGHSNAINEAMMTGMVIVTTRHGFIPSLLDDESCYFVDKNSAASIAEALGDIASQPGEARSKAEKAREVLIHRFSCEVQIPVLEQVYRRLVDKRHLIMERED